MILLSAGDVASGIIDTFNTFQYFRPFLAVFSWMMKTEVHIGLFHASFMEIFIFTGLASWICWIAGYVFDIWKS